MQQRPILSGHCMNNFKDNSKFRFHHRFDCKALSLFFTEHSRFLQSGQNYLKDATLPRPPPISKSENYNYSEVLNKTHLNGRKGSHESLSLINGRNKVD